MHLTLNGRPRLVQVNKQQTWYVFTDASYSKDDPVLPCGVGGLLFDDKGVLVAGFSHALSSDVRKLLGEINKDTIIMEAEFVAVLLAFRLWGKRVAHSPVVAFIDNKQITRQGWCPSTCRGVASVSRVPTCRSTWMPYALDCRLIRGLEVRKCMVRRMCNVCAPHCVHRHMIGCDLCFAH